MNGPTKAECEAAHCWESVDEVRGQPDTSAYKRSARLQQSRWREAHGYPCGTQPLRPTGDDDVRLLGSRLPLEFAASEHANFLTPTAREAVAHRLKHGEEHQTLDPNRLQADLLSSMPMCFNLFGDLWADMAIADSAVHSWWPDTPGTVGEVRFEWSPGRRDPQYLNNRTAFDVAFLLDLPGDSRGVLGIETKYHEHARSEKPPSGERMARYEEVTEESGVFSPGWRDAIVGTELQQLWLDHLLSLSMLQHPSGTWTWARFVVVHPEQNVSFAEACTAYAAVLADSATFKAATLEELLDQPSALPQTSVALLRDRYLWT